MAKADDLWNPDGIPQKRRTQIANETKQKFNWLKSEIEGLYLEFDKLTKKAPAQRITDLALENVNAAIGDAKELLAGDRSVDRIDVFVAAGENPVNSDVVLILSKLRAALNRFDSTWSRAWRDAGPSTVQRLMDELK